MVSAAVFLGFREGTLLILQGFGFSGFRRLLFALWLLALFILGFRGAMGGIGSFWGVLEESHAGLFFIRQSFFDFYCTYFRDDFDPSYSEKIIKAKILLIIAFKGEN